MEGGREQLRINIADHGLPAPGGASDVPAARVAAIR
jgi:hypothetical protein